MQVELVAFKVNFIGAVPLARLILPVRDRLRSFRVTESETISSVRHPF